MKQGLWIAFLLLFWAIYHLACDPFYKKNKKDRARRAGGGEESSTDSDVGNN